MFKQKKIKIKYFIKKIVEGLRSIQASEEHKSEDKAAKGTDNQGENVKAAAEDVKASEGQNVAAENKTEVKVKTAKEILTLKKQEAVKEEGAQEKAE